MEAVKNGVKKLEKLKRQGPTRGAGGTVPIEGPSAGVGRKARAKWAQYIRSGPLGAQGVFGYVRFCLSALHSTFTFTPSFVFF